MKTVRQLLCSAGMLAALVPSAAGAEQPQEKAIVAAATSDDFDARNASYSVVINGLIVTGTAVNVKTADATAGYLVTATSALSYTRTLENIRTIHVTDPSRNINRVATIMASDARSGLTLLRTEAPLPRPVTVAQKLPTTNGTVVACAVGPTRSCSSGAFLGVTNVLQGKTITETEVNTDISHLEQTLGAGVFTPTHSVNDSELIGIVRHGKGVSTSVPNTSINELLARVVRK